MTPLKKTLPNNNVTFTQVRASDRCLGIVKVRRTVFPPSTGVVLPYPRVIIPVRLSATDIRHLITIIIIRQAVHAPASLPKNAAVVVLVVVVAVVVAVVPTNRKSIPVRRFIIPVIRVIRPPARAPENTPRTEAPKESDPDPRP